jgi:hypothetical protein
MHCIQGNDTGGAAGPAGTRYRNSRLVEDVSTGRTTKHWKPVEAVRPDGVNIDQPPRCGGRSRHVAKCSVVMYGGMQLISNDDYQLMGVKKIVRRVCMDQKGTNKLQLHRLQQIAMTCKHTSG